MGGALAQPSLAGAGLREEQGLGVQPSGSGRRGATQVQRLREASRREPWVQPPPRRAQGLFTSAGAGAQSRRGVCGGPAAGGAGKGSRPCWGAGGAQPGPHGVGGGLREGTLELPRGGPARAARRGGTAGPLWWGLGSPPCSQLCPHSPKFLKRVLGRRRGGPAGPGTGVSTGVRRGADQRPCRGVPAPTPPADTPPAASLRPRRTAAGTGAGTESPWFPPPPTLFPSLSLPDACV